MPSFDDFLRTGQIGRLAMGMSKDAVRDLLGEPRDTSVRKHPEIWKYGQVELAFFRTSDGSSPVLTSIMYHFDDPTPPPIGLEMTGWVPTCRTTYEGFSAHLDEAGIAFRTIGASLPQESLVLDSTLRVTFSEGRLSSVSSTAKAVAAERKQLSITIPQDDWRALDREAKSRGLSASALCSLWIGENLMSLKGQEA